MFSAVQIVNMGLGKLGAYSISQLTPPRSAVERFVASSYDQWKRSEIAKRRWVFATRDDVALAKQADDKPGDRPYEYLLPVECLRPVRSSRTEWMQRGRTIRSAYDALTISMIMNVDETEFDPMFVDVLACRVAFECCEFVTQSNTKKEAALAEYKDAIDEAGRNNAFTIGPEYYASNDEVFPFLTARY